VNIFGIGGAEMVAIFIIMLVIAGPKRMVRWAYVLGKYVAVLRQMWSQTMDMVQREFDEAGVDIQVPKEMPTRQNLRNSINRSIERAAKPISDPLKETMDEATADFKAMERELDDTAKVARSTTTEKPAEKQSTNGNGSAPSLGSWSDVNKSDG